jgi:hypothetical protein
MWHSWPPLTSITEVLDDMAPNVRVHYHVPRYPHTEKSMEVRVSEITRRPGELRPSDGVIVGRVEVIDYGGEHGSDSLEKLQERHVAWGADPA